MVFSCGPPTFGQFTGTLIVSSIQITGIQTADTDSPHECRCIQKVINRVGKINNTGHQELLDHELVNKNKMVVDAGYRHAGIFVGNQSVHSIES